VPKVRELTKDAPDDAFNVLVINRRHRLAAAGYWRDIKSVHYTTTISEDAGRTSSSLPSPR